MSHLSDSRQEELPSSLPSWGSSDQDPSKFGLEDPKAEACPMSTLLTQGKHRRCWIFRGPLGFKGPLTSFSGLVSKWFLLVFPKSLVFLSQEHGTKSGVFTSRQDPENKARGMEASIQAVAEGKERRGSETRGAKEEKSMGPDD